MSSISNKINLLTLFICLLSLVFIPLKKNIWYDESITILCSKGINYDTPLEFGAAKTINSKSITDLNDNAHVFKATVMDNSNSIFYNTALHYFTLATSNSLSSYIIFSRLFAAASLIALFLLCGLVLGDSLFTSVAIVLLFTDVTFWGMANEVRAYAMGIFFAIMSALYFFKYTLQKSSVQNLLIFGLCSAAAILTHFFTVYIIAVFAVALLLREKLSLFSKGRSVAIIIPVVLLASYFALAHSGLSPQNVHTVVTANKNMASYSIYGTLMGFMKFSAINFKAVYPIFNSSVITLIASFGLVIGCYLYGIRLLGPNRTEKYKFHLLFVLGISAGIFNAIISLRNHTLSSFYFRYFSFSIPFCSLFIAMFLKVFIEKNKGKILPNSIALLILVVPSVLISVKNMFKMAGKVNYNHMTIANKIIAEKTDLLEVPSWNDALLTQSFLPLNCNIDYTLNDSSQSFTLYKGAVTERIPLIRKDE